MNLNSQPEGSWGKHERNRSRSNQKKEIMSIKVVGGTNSQVFTGFSSEDIQDHQSISDNQQFVQTQYQNKANIEGDFQRLSITDVMNMSPNASQLYKENLQPSNRKEPNSVNFYPLHATRPVQQPRKKRLRVNLSSHESNISSQNLSDSRSQSEMSPLDEKNQYDVSPQSKLEIFNNNSHHNGSHMGSPNSGDIKQEYNNQADTKNYGFKSPPQSLNQMPQFGVSQFNQGQPQENFQETIRLRNPVNDQKVIVKNRQDNQIDEYFELADNFANRQQKSMPISTKRGSRMIQKANSSNNVAVNAEPKISVLQYQKTKQSVKHLINSIGVIQPNTSRPITLSLREKYSDQFNQIKDMGFNDEENVLLYLDNNQGNVENTIAGLLSTNSGIEKSYTARNSNKDSASVFGIQKFFNILDPNKDNSIKVDEYVDVKVQDDPQSTNLNQSFGPAQSEDIKNTENIYDPFLQFPMNSGSGAEQSNNLFQYSNLDVKKRPSNSFNQKTKQNNPVLNKVKSVKAKNYSGQKESQFSDEKRSNKFQFQSKKNTFNNRKYSQDPVLNRFKPDNPFGPKTQYTSPIQRRHSNLNFETKQEKGSFQSAFDIKNEQTSLTGVMSYLGSKLNNMLSVEVVPTSSIQSKKQSSQNSIGQNNHTTKVFKVDKQDQLNTNRSSASFGQQENRFQPYNQIQENNKQPPQKNFNHGRHSAETKASSSQSALRRNMSPKNSDGYSSHEAIEMFGHQLTEFERIEMGMYERIYTIGTVRRQNQYSISDKEGFYKVQPGEQLAWRYEVIRIIDAGAFGQVIKCKDFKDPQQRIVAAKISKNKKFDVDNANVEIKILKKLQAGNQMDNEGRDCMVEYIDSFKMRQHVVIIFECLSLNLYNYMTKNKRYKPIFEKDQLRTISRQICQGLKYMLNQSIIHCDMKPENILFTDESYSKVKIIDFGASCEDCSTGFFYVQSRYYRAPEIVLGIQYDHAVDMWSLGCILYELVVGTPLFPAHDENELVEYFIVTISEFPQYMIQQAKKYKQFYNNPGGQLKSLIRSQKSCLGNHIIPGSQNIQQLLEGKTSIDLINFIQKCLALDPEDRITPQAALHHAWLIDI